MKELKELTVERLEYLSSLPRKAVTIGGDELAALAKIALAAKQAKPVAITDRGEVYGLAESGWVGNFMPPDYKGVDEGDEVYLYTTPPLNHNEQHMVVPDGWKLVPIEPTQDMVDAHIDGMHLAGFSRAYRAMLSAAPKPESE